MSNDVEITVRVNADRSGWASARSTAATEGRAAGEEYTRGADGRLRDARGKFVSAGEAAGAGFSDGLSRGASKGGGVSGALSKASKDLDKFKGEVSKVGSAAGSAAAGIGQLGVGAAIVGWAPAAASALAQLAGAALVLPGAMGAAAAVLGTIKMALSGVSEAIGAQGGVSAGMAQSGAAAASMARQIRDAVDGVNDARQQAARVAEDSARRVEDAERNAARVARDGAEAIAEAKASVQEAAQDTAEAVEAANQRLADTEEQVARQIAAAADALTDARVQAARAIEDALQAQQRTVRDTARAIADAERAQEKAARAGADSVARAGERIAKALEREQDAQEDLSQARQDAADDLEDLQAKVAGYAADEGSAQARVARAAEELRKVNASRRFSDVDRQEAAAELAQAEQHLADVQREGRQDADELAKVQAGGIESTKKVQDAAERVADAHAAVVDATADRAKAEQDAAESNAAAAEQVTEVRERAAEQQADAAERVADAEESGAERIQDAQARLNLAREDGARRIQEARAAVTKAAEDGAEREAAAAAALARAERDAAEQRADAQRAVDDAKRASAQANADAAEAVADAEQRLNDTYAQQREQAAQAAASTDTYGAALAKLAPNAQAFVEMIRQLRPEWDALQQSIQQAAFAGLAEQVKALSDTYLPVFRTGLVGIAEQLNAMAIYAASALMSPEAVAAVNAVLQFTAQFLNEAKTALGDFLVGFLQLMAIGASYLPQFGAWLADIAARFREWIDTEAGRQQIVDWINNAFTAFGQLWQVLQNLWTAVTSVFTALGGGGGGLLQTLVDLSARLAEVAQRKDTQELLRTIGDVARTLFQLIVDHLPQVIALAVGLAGISAAAKILGPVLDGVKLAIGGVKLAIEAWRAAQVLLNIVLAANPLGLLLIALAAVAAAVIYLWNTNEGFRTAVINAWNAIGGAAKTVGTAIGNAFKGAWNGLVAGAKAAANGAIGVLNGMIQAANWAIRAFNVLPGPDLPQFGLFPYLAKGGIAGGMAMVGENGPELVKLPQGSTVYPSGQSQGMVERMGGGSGGGRIELVVAGNTDGAMAQALMKMIRGGQIQIRQSQLVAG